VICVENVISYLTVDVVRQLNCDANFGSKWRIWSVVCLRHTS